MSKETGGPAFPVSTIDGHTNDGMTLRDYFAGEVRKAIGVWTPNYIMPSGLSATDSVIEAAAREARAAYCYAEADAMIAERNKP